MEKVEKTEKVCYDGEKGFLLKEEVDMRELLIVIDMQNDFIDGALGTKEAQSIVQQVVQEIGKYDEKDIIATRDTHTQAYLSTQEGKYLPVPHCIYGTHGWEINQQVQQALGNALVLDKPTFGSKQLAECVAEISKEEEVSVTLVGVCTDICVVSNALLLKAYFPEMPIRVIASCCAGVSPETHLAALQTMKMCQIQVIE